MNGTLHDEWRRSLARPGFKLHAALSAVSMILMLGLFTRFIGWVEQREGIVLNDPLLKIITPVDFTWPTFGIIYVAVVLAIVVLARRPHSLLLAMQAYTLMVGVRMAMMFLTPLDPSEGLIVLRDPFVQFFGDGSPPTKDLFFSGHTSTLVLLALVMPRRSLRILYLAFAVLVATFVVWQHVHFTVDVLVAPFVAYTCYRIALLVRQKWFSEN